MSDTTDKKIVEAMSASHDLNTGVETSHRFALLTVPRSGSWLLSKMMERTGLAGLPDEYLNIRNIRVYANINSIKDVVIKSYLQELERRRTSANGTFGLKLHWDQFADVFSNKDKVIIQEGLDFLQEMDVLIRLYRRDKLSQAISNFIAMKTDEWMVTHDSDGRNSTREVEVLFDPVAITNELKWMVWQERMWIEFLQRHKLSYESICYEELVADYEGESRRALTLIGVDESVPVPEQQLKRQANELNARLRSEYLCYLGLSDQ